MNPFFTSDPTAPDPYESKFVDVCSSGIDGAHEGLFAKVSIEVNTTVAFYNGSRADPKDFDPSTWETNNYKIFDPADIPLGTIDIPMWAQVRVVESSDFKLLIFFLSSPQLPTVAV